MRRRNFLLASAALVMAANAALAQTPGVPYLGVRKGIALPPSSGSGAAPLTSSGRVATGTRAGPYSQTTGNTNAIARNWTTSPTLRTKMGITVGHMLLSAANESSVSATPIVWSGWVEYPAGSYQQFTWSSGSLTATTAQLFTADSDEITLATPIPANTDHWVWLTAASAGGLYFNQYQNTAKGETLNIGGAGVPSAPSASPGNVGNYCMPPLVIWSSDANATANTVILGDSREQGVNDVSIINSGSVGYLQAGFMGNCMTDGQVFLNLSTGGSRAGNQAGSDWPTGWSCRKRVLKFFSHPLLCLGFNDLTVDGRSAATTKTAIEVCTADILSANTYARIIMPTIGPRSTSAGGGWNSLADQSNIGDPQRTDHNANIRSGLITGNTGGYLEVGNLLDAGGKWAMGPTFRNITDGTTNAGTGVLTSATANFTAADVGAGVAIPGAGAAGGLLLQPIVSVTNSTTCVLLAVGTTIAAGAAVTISCPTEDGLHGVPQIYRVPKNNGIPAALALKMLV